MRTTFLSVLAAVLIAPASASAQFSIGQGFKPSVAVDGNGTAYIAWYGPEANVTTLQFCRLPRGATSCDIRHSLTPPGTSLSRPYVIVSGDTVRLVQFRYGINPTRIFLVTSTNGGVTFDGGVAVGDVPFDEAVAGPDGTLTVATNAFQEGGVVQSVPLTGGAAGGFAAVGGAERPYNGTVGITPDGRRVAVFATGASDAAFWLHSGGDPNVVGTWGAPVGLGYADYPRLATGAGALYLLAGASGVPQGMYVRRWTGSEFGAPVTVGPGDASESDLFIDPGGRLHAVWSRLDAQGYHLQHSVSDDGVTWRSGSVLVQTEDQVGAPRVAAAADHVGVAVWSARSGGAPQINVVAIGPDAPAPPPAPPPPPVEQPPAEPAPQFNRTVVVRPVRGVVRVRLPGSNRFVRLTSIDDIPFGATLDTRRGEVELRSLATRTGPVQSVRLKDGWFRVSFSRGITNFTLNEPLARCSRRASAAARKRKSRRLWGNGSGRFRTTGKYSAATVRGTRWLVQDTCAGTRTRVREGRVAVRDRVRKRTIVLRGPRGTYLARPRR
ncbi:MAG TPA: hypothetical protein VFZ00_24425 [Solirubrobacter sp.]|nr:hypothetical protein [Solirubrobacter sp.]